MNSLSTGQGVEQITASDFVDEILVIDDDADWLVECKFMLGSLGYNAVTASTREEAVEAIEAGNVSTVIVDYSMPGCDGLTLAQELSDIARDNGRTLRFILATGHATLEVAVGAIRASVTDFLQKPISRDQLKTTLLRVQGVEIQTPARSTLVTQLSSLSSEMQRLASLIGEPGASSVAASPISDGGKIADAAFIRRLLRQENKRREIGNGSLFGDPTWAMLLDLVIARFENRTVSVSSACIASGAPTTTALRLVNRLVGESILERVPDQRDGRRDFLIIAPDIEALLVSYLNDLAKAS